MKTRLLIIASILMMLLTPAMPQLSPARAEKPQVFMGVAGDNGYVAVTADGRVRYNVSNSPRYYYGWCGHHHKRHRCRFVKPPRRHQYHHKHKKHYKKHHKKHHRHHDRDDDDDDDDHRHRRHHRD